MNIRIPFFVGAVVLLACASVVADVERVMTLSDAYLLLPVKNGAAKRALEIRADGKVLRKLDVEFAEGRPDWTAPVPVAGLRGRKVTLRLVGAPETYGAALNAVKTVPVRPQGVDMKTEPLRPQLRFTQRYGWNNDPNGMTYYKGEWHLFFQNNPCGIQWGNMHWGHAVSKDLVHWTELDTALAPDELGTMFSGSGVVDVDNVAGFGAGAHLLYYTAAGHPFTQCLAASTNGRTYEKWSRNPVLGNLSGGNRDPKVFWHAPSRHWVMVLYGFENNHHVFYVFNSADLTNWTKVQTLVGDAKDKGTWRYECPELEELPIEGERGTAWVLWGAGSLYDVGTFDGRTFTAVEERLAAWPLNLGTPYYAAQTFNNAPDGRVIAINWFKIGTGGASTFGQGFSLPHELTLRRTKDGLRLVRRPVRELEALRAGPAVAPEAFEGELAEAFLACTVGKNAHASFDLRGVRVVYDAAKGTLSALGQSVAWPVANNRLALRVFVDRNGMEIFAQDGLQVFPVPAARPDPANRRISVRMSVDADTPDFRVYPLKSIHP